MKALYQKIRSLDGKNYGLYKTLAEKAWNFGDFTLEFIHIQGDPYAKASKVMIKAKLQNLGFTSEWSSTFERRLSLSDFLLRALCHNIHEKYPDKDADIIIISPGPEMLVRNSLWIDNGELRACFQVKLPGENRKIQADKASEILTMILPDIVCASLFNRNSKNTQNVCEDLLNHYQVLFERNVILKELKKQNLIAFVPDGAILPRESGDSEQPLKKAIPFYAPNELAITLTIGKKEIRGMGIPKGISVITGGAFHGKSTLLQALIKSVYPHIPKDGREGIVIDESALRISVEEGRYVRGTDISSMVRNLPGNIDTKNFCTSSASGSTSETANLLEAMEASSRTFLIDEDSSAVNFLIRDNRVRELLGDENEPLIPLTDRIIEFSKKGYNFIIVAGACGEFLSIADNVIVMANYKAECETSKTKLLFKKNINELKKPFNLRSSRNMYKYIKPLEPYLRPNSAVEKQIKVKLNGDSLLQIGFLTCDVSKSGLLVDKQHKLGVGFILLNLCQNVINNSEQNNLSILDAAKNICNKIQNTGFRNISQGLSQEISLPRPIDIVCAAYRLKKFVKN